MELWRVLAPAGETSFLRFLETEWQLPQSSISSARSMVEFYNGQLGWSLDKMEDIGRAKLTRAKPWLEVTHQAGKLDNNLVTLLLSDDTTVEEVTVYTATARQEYQKALGKPAQVKLSDSVGSIEMDDDDSDDDDTDDDDTDDTDEQDSEPVAERPQAPLPGVVEATAAAAQAAPKPFRIRLDTGGDKLSDVIWRAIFPFLEYLEDDEVGNLQDVLTQRFGTQQTIPLIVWDDNQPVPVGMVLISHEDQQLLQRVVDGLKERL